MENSYKCHICGVPSIHGCGTSQEVFYCSKEHEAFEWQDHKQSCKPYKVYHDEQGFYVVAIKPFQEGEVVLQELPLATGPKLPSPPLCMGCLKILDLQLCIICKKCGWPVCNERCANSPRHQPECYYTTKRMRKNIPIQFRFSSALYDGVFVLRCLFLKQFYPDKWTNLNMIPSHLEEMKTNEVYEFIRKILENIIHGQLDLRIEFSIEEIMKMWAILKVNQENLPLTNSYSKAIYATSPLFEHNCKANCFKSIDAQGNLRVVAAVAIQKGERLSLCYTNPLWTTFNRLQHLEETRFLKCKCDRCSDPTEYGTFFSGVKCPRFCLGFLLPPSFVTQFNQEAVWTCSSCKRVPVQRKVVIVTEDGDENQENQENQSNQENEDNKGNQKSQKPLSDYNAYKAYLANMRKVLPEYHSFIINAKIPLMFIIGHPVYNEIMNVSCQDLELKEQLCKEILNILRILAPAENKIKGCVMVQYQITLEEIQRRNNIRNNTSGSSSLEPDKSSIIVLTEAVKWLKYEPSGTYEGHMYFYAQQRLCVLQK